MDKLIKTIQEYDDFVSTGIVDDSSIEKAEKELGLVFNKSYRIMIGKFGVASVNGHELLGICDSKRLNIVDATIKAKKKNPSVLEDMYLIEDIGIDNILVWQNEKGELFQTVGNGEPEKMDINLIDYIEE